jgi:hypothetical protein
VRFVWVLIVSLLALLLAWSDPSRATEGACGDAARGWVRHASSTLPFAVQLQACFASQRVLLDLGERESLPVEVAVGPGSAFRTVGALRVSPVLEVPDFAQVSPARRQAFDQFTSWLAANEAQVVSSFSRDASLTAPPAVGGRPLPWILLFAGLFAIVGAVASRRRRPSPAPRIAPDDAIVAAASFVVALAARLVLGPWGPLHLNGQGALWILRLTAPTDGLPLYGPGYRELFYWIARAGPPDTMVFAANAVCSAACVTLAFVVARQAGLDARRAALVPAAMVLDGVLLRTSATEGYFASILLLALLATALLQAAVRRWEYGARTAAVLWTAAAGLFAVQGARIHPCAWLVVACIPLAAATALRGSVAARTKAAIAGGAMLAAAMALTSSGALLGAYRFALAHHSVSESPMVLPWLRLALAAAAAAGIAMLARPRAVALPWAVHMLALLATSSVYTGHPAWHGGYQSLFLVWPWIGLAAVVPERLASRPTWWLAPAALAAVIALAGIRTVRDRTTDQEEYRYTRQWLRGLAPGCRVMYLHRAGLRLATLPEFVAPDQQRPRFVRLATGAESTQWPAFGDAECVYYYRSSLCSTEDGYQACEDVQRQYAMREESSLSLAPRPDPFGRPNVSRQVYLGFYRLLGERRP